MALTNSEKFQIISRVGAAKAALSGVYDGNGGTGAVSSVNTKVGDVVLTATDVNAATASQGAKADTAVQTVNNKTGNTITLAAADIGAATSAQGTKADSAIQSVNGKTGNSVTLAAADVGAATTAQGALANTAVQQVAGKGLSTNDYTTAEKTLVANRVSSAAFRLCIIGTSLIQQNDVATAAKVSHWNRGWMSHARFYAKGLWDVVSWQDPTVRTGWEPSGTAGATRFFYGANCGVSGQTIAQIQARIPLILSSLPNVDAYCFDGGTNDMSTLSKEDIQTARVACLELLKVTGKPIIVLPILARGTGSWASGSAERFKANWINQQTLEYVHKNPSMTFFDWNRNWVNSSNVDGAPFTGYSPDDIHFNPAGGQPVGLQFSQFMSTLVRGQPLTRVVSQGDVYNATNNPRGNLVANQFCLGTTGGVGTNVTGTVATALRVEMTTTSPAGTATAVASKEVRADNRGEWQVITVTPGDADTTFYFRTNTADTAHTIPAGTWVQASMECSIGAFSGWQGVSLYLKDNGTGGLITYDMEPFEVTTGVFNKLPTIQQDGMLVTMPIKLVSDSASLRLRAEVKVASTGNGSTGTGVVKFGAVELRVCANPQELLGYTGG